MGAKSVLMKALASIPDDAKLVIMWQRQGGNAVNASQANCSRDDVAILGASLHHEATSVKVQQAS